MSAVRSLLLSALALAALGPVAVVSAECLAALLTRRDRRPAGSRPTLAVLVPARNESASIRRTIDSIQPQLGSRDRLVVIADNCVDDTAALARDCGATVIERHDSEAVGKSYAMAHGVRHLTPDPPQVVIVIDGDCQLESGALDALARRATATGGPVQGKYVLSLPPEPSTRDLVSGAAFTLKNVIRPMGLASLGQPCFLNGSGMALPWTSLRQVRLANGRLSDDRWLTADLALAGYRTTFCPEACVRGELPRTRRAARDQRKRWSHGDLEALLVLGPRLLGAAVLQRRLDLLALGLHVSVPPLSLLAGLWLVTGSSLAVAAAAGGPRLPLALVVAGGGVGLASLVAAWAKLAQQEVPLRALVAVPAYVVWSLKLQLAFATSRQRSWFRTDRDQLQGRDAR